MAPRTPEPGFQLFFGPTSTHKETTDKSYDNHSHPQPLKHSTPATATKSATRKRIKVAGGSAAVPKPITANPDREDQIIVDMKQQGYSGVEVAQRLRDDGLTDYQPASIDSRYVRLRRAAQAEYEKQLEEELTDWHDGEDEILLNAYERADERLNTELAKVREKRWGYVAIELNHRLANSRFSSKSCKDRYEAIENGSARPPPELDDDPEARRVERFEKTAAHKIRKREEAKAKARAIEEAADQKTVQELRKEAGKLKQNEKSAHAAARRKKEQEEKEKIKDDKKMERAKRERQIEAYKAELEAEAAEKKLENEVLDREKKKAAQRKEAQVVEDLENSIGVRKAALLASYRTGTPLHTTNSGRQAKTATMERVRAETNVTVDKGAETSSSAASRSAAHLIVKTTPSSNHDISMFEDADGVPSAPRAHHSTQTPQPSFASAVTTNARKFMNADELYNLLKERGMSLERRKIGKTGVLGRIEASDNAMPITQIKKLLATRRQSQHGDRATLLRRLAEADFRIAKSWSVKKDAEYKAANAALARSQPLQLMSRQSLQQQPRGQVSLPMFGGITPGACRLAPPSRNTAINATRVQSAMGRNQAAFHSPRIPDTPGTASSNVAQIADEENGDPIPEEDGDPLSEEDGDPLSDVDADANDDDGLFVSTGADTNVGANSGVTSHPSDTPDDQMEPST